MNLFRKTESELALQLLKCNLVILAVIEKLGIL